MARGPWTLGVDVDVPLLDMSGGLVNELGPLGFPAHEADLRAAL